MHCITYHNGQNIMSNAQRNPSIYCVNNVSQKPIHPLCIYYIYCASQAKLWTEMNWHWKSLELVCTSCILHWMFVCMYVYCNCIYGTVYLWNVLLNCVWNISARSTESTLDFELCVQYSRTWIWGNLTCFLTLELCQTVFEHTEHLTVPKFTRNILMWAYISAKIGQSVPEKTPKVVKNTYFCPNHLNFDFKCW